MKTHITDEAVSKYFQKRAESIDRSGEFTGKNRNFAYEHGVMQSTIQMALNDPRMMRELRRELVKLSKQS